MDAGIAHPVGVQELGIGERASDLSLHASCERSLLAEFSLDDIGVIQQSERVLPDSETDRVEPGRVLHQVVDACIHPETFFR